MKTITLLLLCSLPAFLCAQQLPLFGQYRENHAFINPASLSSNYWNQETPYRNELGVTYRRQWVGLEDGPLTMTARYEVIPAKFRSVFGLQAISDKTGPTGQNGAQLRYAYLLMDNDGNSGQWLSVGGSMGYYQYYYHGDEIIFRDAGDAVGAQNITTGQVDANVGIFYAAEIGDRRKVFYCGASMMQIASVTFADGLKRTPHFYGNIGFFKNMETRNEESYFIEPSAWVRYVPNTPVQLDLTCRFHTPNYFWVGIGQSFSVSAADGGKALKGNNLLFEAGVTLGDKDYGNQLTRIGFGYHRSFTRFGAYLGNTYEFNATYVWK